MRNLVKIKTSYLFEVRCDQYRNVPSWRGSCVPKRVTWLYWMCVLSWEFRSRCKQCSCTFLVHLKRYKSVRSLYDWSSCTAAWKALNITVFNSMWYVFRASFGLLPQTVIFIAALQYPTPSRNKRKCSVCFSALYSEAVSHRNYLASVIDKYENGVLVEWHAVCTICFEAPVLT